MVTQATNMSLSSKREYLARIYGRYQRAGRPHKSRILDEFCLNCDYHRKAALRLLLGPGPGAFKKRPGPKPTYDAERLRPVLKIFWLATDQLCSKRLHAALPEWLGHYGPGHRPLSAELRKQLLAISPAQIDRLLRPARVRHPRRGLATTKPGSLLRTRIPTRGGPPDTATPGHIEADTVAHCGDTTAGDFVYSLTFTDLFSGWTENRAVWNKGTQGILDQLKDLEAQAPFALKSFHADNGSEFLNWALYEHLTGRPLKVLFTRSRAYRKNDNAHCEQKNYTFVRQLFGHERFEHAELVALMNDLYAREWSQYQNHFRPTFKLLGRDKRGSKTVRRYAPLQTPYERLLESPDVAPVTKARLRAEHGRLNPFALKKAIEEKLRKFFTVLGNLDRESTKP
jgi:transposase InsO family protein